MREPSLRAAARSRCSRSAPSYIASGTSDRCCGKADVTVQRPVITATSIRLSVISGPLRIVQDDAFIGREVHVRPVADLHGHGRMRAHMQHAFAYTQLKI